MRSLRKGDRKETKKEKPYQMTCNKKKCAAWIIVSLFTFAPFECLYADNVADDVDF